LRILTCFFCFYCFYFVFICLYFVFICFYFVFICLYLFLLFLFVFICFYFVDICFCLFSFVLFVCFRKFAPGGGGDFLHTSLVILTVWSRGRRLRGRILVQTTIFITFERRRENRSRDGFRVAGNGQIVTTNRLSKNVIKPE